MSNLWAGEFGNDYTRRSGSFSTVEMRAAVWAGMIPDGARSVLEVGANIGQNLEAIAQTKECELYACEPNDEARNELRASRLLPPDHITADCANNLSFAANEIDLVFTSGVLIHISADELLPSMREIHRVSRRWIICAEYFAPTEEMVPYRGLRDVLWRRDYGSLWLDNFPDLKCTLVFFAWKRVSGLDNVMFWRFEKGARPN